MPPLHLRQRELEVGGEVDHVHLGLLELSGEVPVHGLPAGELVEHPDPGQAAAVARLAVAAEGQVRLGAARGVVDREHPGPVALPEAQGVRRVAGVDRRGEPVAVGVAELYRLVEVGELRNTDERAEGLGVEDLVFGRNTADERGVAEEAGLGVAYKGLAGVLVRDAARSGGAVYGVVVLYHVEEAGEAVGETLAEHRAVENVFGHRVAYLCLLDPLRQPGDELVVDGLVDDGGAQRGAPLAGGAEAAEEGALDGEVEVGVGHHDERVFAPEFQAGGLKVPAAERAYLLAHLRGAGKADLVHEALVECPLQALEGGRALALDDVQDAVGEAAGLEELGEGVADGGGVFGRFPDNGVAAGEGRDQVPRRHGHGEVPGRYDRRDPHRHPEREELLVRHLARHGLAVEAAAPPRQEVRGVFYLLHLAQRLDVGLADLEGDEAGEGLLVLLDDAPDFLYDLRPYRRRHRGPVLLRPARRPAGLHESAGVP